MRGFASAGLALLAVAGCVSADNMADKLRDTSAAYNRAVRWGDVDRAAQYVPPRSRARFMRQHEVLGTRLVVVEYEITRLDLDRSRGVAASRAELAWHTERDLVVRRTTVDQVWQFHAGNFVLVDERRAAGAPLSSVAELQEQPHPYLPGLAAFRKQHDITDPDKRQRRKSASKPESSAQYVPTL